MFHKSDKITVRVPPKLKQDITELAYSEGKGVSEYTRHLLEKILENKCKTNRQQSQI